MKTQKLIKYIPSETALRKVGQACDPIATGMAMTPERDNDTSVQPQPQAMGAVSGDPRERRAVCRLTTVGRMLRLAAESLMNLFQRLSFWILQRDCL